MLTPVKALKPTKSVILFEKSDNEKLILRPSDAENVSNMSQSVRNIIINDHKHVLDLNKSYKGHLQKNPAPHTLKTEILICPILWIRIKTINTQLSLTFFH